MQGEAAMQHSLCIEMILQGRVLTSVGMLQNESKLLKRAYESKAQTPEIQKFVTIYQNH